MISASAFFATSAGDACQCGKSGFAVRFHAPLSQPSSLRCRAQMEPIRPSPRTPVEIMMRLLSFDESRFLMQEAKLLQLGSDNVLTIALVLVVDVVVLMIVLGLVERRGGHNLGHDRIAVVAG